MNATINAPTTTGHFLAAVRIQRRGLWSIAAFQLRVSTCLRQGIDGTQKQQDGNDQAHRLGI
ncbi:MAG TPA: hypothetical protein VET30_06635 [Pseudoxanthomonas sp.]|nr:hypothetical protein [Pseudoxanthomonas sp.]